MNALLLIGSPLLIVGAVQFAFGFLCLFRGKSENRLLVFAGIATLAAACFSTAIGLVYVRDSLGLDYSIYYRFAWISPLCIPALAEIIFQMRKRVHPLVRFFNSLSW